LHEGNCALGKFVRRIAVGALDYTHVFRAEVDDESIRLPPSGEVVSWFGGIPAVLHVIIIVR
jgi:hypothetical protein